MHELTGDRSARRAALRDSTPRRSALRDPKLRLIAALALGSGLLQVAQADTAGKPRWGITNVKAPPRWEVQPPGRTYPQLLFWASRGHGEEQAVMTLVVQRFTKGTSVQQVADQSAVLIKSGVKAIRRQAQAIDGWGGHRVQFDGLMEGTQRKVVRQLYFMNGPLGYVLTLVAPQAQAVPRLRDLEDTFHNLEMLPPDETAPIPAVTPPLPPPVPVPVPGDNPSLPTP